MNNQDGGQAFPHGDPTHGGDIGMTLRDYFAAKALQGMLANPTIEVTDNSVSPAQAVAEAAYLQADAMLTERERRDD